MDAKIYSVEKASFDIKKSNPPQLVINAAGTVNSSGWKNARRLVPWIYYTHEPADGIQDFEFIAIAPTGPVLRLMSPITSDAVITQEDWMKGFRIHTLTNKIEVMLDDSNCHENAKVMAENDAPIPLAIQ